MALFSNPKKKLAKEAAHRLISGHGALLATLALKHAGVFAAIAAQKDGLDPAEFAEAQNMSSSILSALLAYLLHHDIVLRRNNRYFIAPTGEALLEFDDGLLEHFHAYQPVLQMLEHLLARLKSYGSAGITRRTDSLLASQSKRFATEVYPAIEEAITRANATCLLDLSCGTGELPVQAATDHKLVVGVGIGSDSPSVHLANDLIAANSLDKRLMAITASPIDVCTDTRRAFDRAGISPHLWEKFDAVIACSLFTEMLHLGREKIIPILRSMHSNFPKASFILAEPVAGPHFDRNYYAPEMQLLLELTNTQLLTMEQWSEILTQSGFSIQRQALLSTDGVAVFICTGSSSPTPRPEPAKANTTSR